jgi:hypothetical protein
MSGLSSADLFQIWEHACSRNPARQALTMLETADTRDLNSLERLPIGRRDGALLQLRAETFGQRALGVTKCPACGDALELELDTSELVCAFDDVGDSFSIDVDGEEVTFRLPSSLDLEAIVGENDVGRARQALVERCILSPVSEVLVDKVVNAVIDRMAELDPLGDIQLALSCPSCGHSWRGCFDPAAFLWDEVQSWVSGAIHDVHLLASAYGWHESDILAIPPGRRRLYLELAS